jgi:IgA Peptidase M64
VPKLLFLCFLCVSSVALCVSSVAQGPVPAPLAPATVVPVSVNGDPAARFSLVVMSDGYTAADMPKYRRHLDKHLNVLWSIEPFRSYRNYINVYSVEIVSPDSGITCDPEVREKKNTPLSAIFGGGCTNPNARGITVNQNAAREYAKQATPHFDQILVITNTDTYGGIGGSVATTSGGNSLGVLITPHEIGHSLGRLQDEYTYSARGVPGGEYKGGEPDSIHHTLMSEEQMRSEQKKWWRWLGEESESGGKIGRFEGGRQNTKGIWRPSKHSMMISIGYPFDQVSRERMVQRISEQVQLIANASPTEMPVGSNDVLWIETAHPNDHELDITWTIDGKEYAAAKNIPSLNVNAMDFPGGAKPTFTVTVTDPTPWVRDPEIRGKALTTTRTWTYGGSTTSSGTPDVKFTVSTPTDRPVGARDVVYAETTHPAGRALNVTWRLNGSVIKTPPGSRTLRLADQQLRPGTHKLTATVTDPRGQARASDTREWVIDNTMPTVRYTLEKPTATSKKDGLPHFTFTEEFTMKLEPSDDQKGYVVAEFRVNGDGWHHYYGWPDAPEGTPYKFTPRGTTIKELVYGSLSSEGLSPQPWEERKPGYGTHKIEVRAIDAAGNIGPLQAFYVTVTPK